MTNQTRCAPWSAVSFKAMASVLALVLFFSLVTGCGGDKKKAGPVIKEFVWDKLPRNEAVIKIDGREVSGACLRNWCYSEYFNLLKRTKGMPIQFEEYDILMAGMKILGQMNAVAVEATKRGLVVSDAEVNLRLSKEATAYESTAQWREVLEKSGLTEKDRRDQIRVEALFEKYRDEVVLPEVKAKYITEENVKKYYEQHRDLFKVPDMLHLFHISRKLAKEATEEQRTNERQAIEKGRQRILKGEAFESVAREISTDPTALKGGDLGFAPASMEFPPPIKDALAALKAGDLSQVVALPSGFHLFKVSEIKPGRLRTFEESREEIKKRMADQGLKMEMERRATQLRAQLIADKKYLELDIKGLLGESAKEKPAGGPTGAPAGNVPPEKP